MLFRAMLSERMQYHDKYVITLTIALRGSINFLASQTKQWQHIYDPGNVEFFPKMRIFLMRPSLSTPICSHVSCTFQMLP